MKRFLHFTALLLFFGCATQVSQEDLNNLNGYWEIEQVTFPGGETKDFTVNPSVDYIELNDLMGFRKKMQPKFDGSFTTSDDAEPFEIKTVQDGFEFHYENEMSKWVETIQSVSKDHFSVVNEDNITYTYKRFRPIDIDK